MIMLILAGASYHVDLDGLYRHPVALAAWVNSCTSRPTR